MKESAREYAQLGRELSFDDARTLVSKLWRSQGDLERVPPDVIDYFAGEMLALHVAFLVGAVRPSRASGSFDRLRMTKLRKEA